MDEQWLQQLFQSLNKTINGFKTATPEQMAQKADPSVADQILSFGQATDSMQQGMQGSATAGAMGGMPSFDSMLTPQSDMQAYGLPVGNQSVVNLENPGAVGPAAGPTDASGLTAEQMQKLLAMMPASERRAMPAPGVIAPQGLRQPMAPFTVGSGQGQQGRLGGGNPTLGSLIRGGR